MLCQLVYFPGVLLYTVRMSSIKYEITVKAIGEQWLKAKALEELKA